MLKLQRKSLTPNLAPALPNFHSEFIFNKALKVSFLASYVASAASKFSFMDASLDNYLLKL